MNFCRILVLSLTFLSSIVSATETKHAENLELVYEHSGVDAHLSWVNSTVLEESQLAWQNCKATEKHPITDALLADVLSIEALRRGFIEELDNRITKPQLDQIVAWTTSDAGANIYKAEKDSVNFDEATFEAKLASYQKSGAFVEPRVTRLKDMLADTGAVYFLSALNTELSALVSITSVCSNDDAAIAAANQVIAEDRGAEALYRSFMRQGLVMPSGVVYQDVSDADIDALITFAKTESGNAYYSALIKGVRSLLSEKVSSIEKLLIELAKSE